MNLFLNNNNYFILRDTNCQQIFGCPMGSPVSAILANLVMEHIEEIAIGSAPHPPSTEAIKRTDRRYVINALKDNSYPEQFIKSSSRKKKKKNNQLLSNVNKKALLSSHTFKGSLKRSPGYCRNKTSRLHINP